MLSPIEKLFFWSGIMQDHAEFFLLSLSYKETDFIRSAQYFRDAFAGLRAEMQSLSASSTNIPVTALTNKIVPLLLQFINFKRLAVRKLLQCDIDLAFTPSFVNHMINEAMEFYRDNCSINAGISSSTTAENILLHKIWLPDAAGHAAAVAADLDPTETMLIKEAKDFKKAFDSLFIKANELGQMLERACLDNGSLEWLNTEAENKISEFICYLDRVRELRSKCKAMGTLKPEMADHMIREENYYLKSIKR